MVLGFFFCIGKAAADTDIFHEGNMVTYLYLWIQREAMVGGFRMKAESKRFYHGLVLGLVVELAAGGIPKELIFHYGFAFEGKRVLVG